MRSCPWRYYAMLQEQEQEQVQVQVQVQKQGGIPAYAGAECSRNRL